ncbi:amidohydrolase family protein [Steroidobacter sp.]|uniref:amidohydrolase family protein n=1 Tax=Steroidobacter sp. TaxID=1978227 RepID=UPI001A498053|nr:amidohydrolase family protein [Steroidobacter sp.]MBL8269818.1 amidohydrolase family protein [Steroidobacter sp.]
MNRSKLLLCLIAGLLTAPTQAAPASPPVVLTGADLYTISHGVIQRGELLIRDGKIAAIGARVDAPADAQRIDVAGKRVYPGFINAVSTLGLNEYALIPAAQDFAETGENNANLHAEVAVNPESEQWPVVRAAGVLAALIVPQVRDGGLFAGQSALMQPQGWTGRQMTIADEVAMHLYWPSKPALRQRLDQVIEQARVYASAQRAGEVTMPDLRLQALGPVLERKQLLAIHASTASQIRDALAFAEKEQLRIVLVSDSGAQLAAKEIAARNVPVIFTGGAPTNVGEGYMDVYSAAGKLAAAGVRVVIANPGGNAKAGVRLLTSAATYAAYGLGDEAALRAITLTPAEVLGVADRLGSLDVGKSATLIVANGDALLPTHRVELAWIDGKPVDLKDNHHEKLYQKYQRKFRELAENR